MPAEKDYQMMRDATLYQLRRLFTGGEQETYTKQEIADLIDKIANAKDQES